MTALERFRGATLMGVLLLLLGLGAPVPRAWADNPGADPGGAKTGTAADVMDGAGNAFVVPEPTDKSAPDYAEKLKAYQEYKAQVGREPLVMKLADSVGQARVAINLMWILLAGFLVMFMQAGFALVETGFCRAKNAAHTMMMNFFVYPLGMFGFFVAGYALMYGAMNVGSIGSLSPLSGNEFSLTLAGKSWGLFGSKGFFLQGPFYDVGVYTMFLFQMVFMDTAVTIPTGAMAERWKTSSFVVYSFFMSMLLYPLFGNWAWGGGWLSQLGVNLGLGNGYVDFAGSGVVHTVGGLCGLAGAMVLGPRIGKYGKDGKANAFPGHHLPMAILGTFILAFGWFGFNPGSTLAVAGGGGLRIGIVATVTMLAGTGGALAAAFYWWLRYGKPDPSMTCNGMLAGLVAITAPSGFVSAGSGFIIGVVAGFLVCWAVPFFDRVHVDDPVGAISVHGVNGLWGVVAVGLFADGTYGAGWNGVAGRAVTGLFYGGGMGQLTAQLIGCATLVVWAFGLSYAFFKVQNAISPIRVSADVELAGLDMPEVGAEAYPAFQPAGTVYDEAPPEGPAAHPTPRRSLSPGEVTS